MPRKRTGSLVEKPSGFFARISVDLPDGATERRWFDLETTDRALALRKKAKLVKLLDEGRLVAQAKQEVAAPETFADYAASWHAKRVASGVAMARDEKNNLDRYILPEIGRRPLGEIRATLVRQVLERATERGLSHETVRKIRGVMGRIFMAAMREELVLGNPVSVVQVPEEAAKDMRDRAVLSDEEVRTYMLSTEGNTELKVLSFASRVVGGMRTAELNRLTWALIDWTTWELKIPRAKQKRGTRGKVQPLTVPEVMRPILQRWWTEQGSPATGPMFPVQRGPRKGLAKVARGTSYAARLRRDLLRAGVRRHECARAPSAPPTRAGEACCPNMAHDPLYFPTEVSLPADFHSFRRAFATALAEAGVNQQTAMALSSHSDGKTHALYVMSTAAMKRVPDAALPQLGARIIGIVSPAVTNHVGVSNDRISETLDISGETQCARTDSNGRHSASKADALSS